MQTTGDRGSIENRWNLSAVLERQHHIAAGEGQVPDSRE
jgi:hypothetical protein